MPHRFRIPAFLLTLALLPGACAGPQVATPTKDDAFASAAPESTSPHLATGSQGSESLASLPERMTLEQAVDLVLARNPRLDGAAANLAAAEAEMAASQVAFRPRIGLGLEYLRSDAPSTYLFKTIDSRGFVPGTDFNHPGTFSNWEAGLQFGYNLYAGGKSRLQERITELQRASTLADTRVLGQRLIAATHQVWLQVEGVLWMERIAEKARMTVEAQRLELQVRYEEGQVRKADLLSMDARLASADAELAAAGFAVARAELAMASLMGLSREQLPEFALDPEAWDRPVPEVEVVEARSQALAQRPELEAMRLRLQEVQLQGEQADVGGRPQVDLFGQVWADNPELFFEGSEANWTLGLALSWDLYDGGLTEVQRARAKGARMALEAQDRGLWLQVQTEVDAAFLAMREARVQVAAAERGLAAAEESFRLVQVQFEEGMASITRYLEAEQMFTTAMHGLALARLAERQAEVAMALATGTLRPQAAEPQR